VLQAHFTLLDWLILLGYLLFTTLLGARLAGRQATIRDFFLGGRKLPWWAVSGSIIATEISAVTFIGVPAIVYRAGGDLTYLQLTLGAILARLIIALWFVPAFYQREIYSPYEYMGQRLGTPVRSVTSGLFLLGAVLGQSVRLLLTAIILQLMTGVELWLAIWLIGALAVLWTLLGGITTVIWTDVIQFAVFTLGLVAALGVALTRLPGGWGEVMTVAAAAGKLRVWNLTTDPQEEFTLWTALLANTLLCLNAYGTDQLIAQRMFCCRGPRAARLAIIASSLGHLVTLLAVGVGLTLYAFYQRHPLHGSAAASVATRVDNVFPVFILQEIPPGLTGLVIAGVFAAAISSLDSVLAALSQTVVSHFYRPWRQRRLGTNGRQKDDERHYLWAARLLVVVWGIVLCAMAHVAELASTRYRELLNLALAMASYTGGALLAAFFFAFLRLNLSYRGIMWSAPLSVLMVFALSWHQPWAIVTTIAASLTLLAAWLFWTMKNWRNGESSRTRTLLRGLALGAGAASVVLVCITPVDESGQHLVVAWPWNVPVGFVVAFAFGILLDSPRSAAGGAKTHGEDEPASNDLTDQERVNA